MRQLIAILLLLNFLLFILPISTSKSVAKQFSSSMPAEEEHGHNKTIDIKVINIKLLFAAQVSKDIFYLLSKEKFSHYYQHTLCVEWLETFSPPPDLV